MTREGLHRFFSDVLNIFPEFFGFFIIQYQRGVIRGPSHINFYGYRILPDLHFAMGDAIKIQCAVTDSNEVHSPAPFPPVSVG